MCRHCPTKKNKSRVPKRVHKAEREKLKREHLNDLFLDLANAVGKLGLFNWLLCHPSPYCVNKIVWSSNLFLLNMSPFYWFYKPILWIILIKDIPCTEVNQPNNGKACVLNEAARLLKDLFSQIESLNKENASLLSESHYVRPLDLIL